jgi:hypothetical protein
MVVSAEPTPPREGVSTQSAGFLDARFAQTTFLEARESARARKALEVDRRWLRTKRVRGR